MVRLTDDAVARDLSSGSIACVNHRGQYSL